MRRVKDGGETPGLAQKWKYRKKTTVAPFLHFRRQLCDAGDRRIGLHSQQNVHKHSQLTYSMYVKRRQNKVETRLALVLATI